MTHHCARCGAELPRLADGQQFWANVRGERIHPIACPSADDDLPTPEGLVMPVSQFTGD